MKTIQLLYLITILISSIKLQEKEESKKITPTQKEPHHIHHHHEKKEKTEEKATSEKNITHHHHIKTPKKSITKTKTVTKSITKSKTDSNEEINFTLNGKCNINGYISTEIDIDSSLSIFNFVEMDNYFKNINLTALELCYLRCSPELESSKIICDNTFLKSMQKTCEKLDKTEKDNCLKIADQNKNCLKFIKTEKTCKSLPPPCRVLRTKYLQINEFCEAPRILDDYKCLYSDGSLGSCQKHNSIKNPELLCLKVSENCDEKTGVFGVCFENNEGNCYENLQTDGFYSESFNLKTFRDKGDLMPVSYFVGFTGLREDPDSLFAFQNELCNFDAFEVLDLEYGVPIPLSCNSK